MRIKLSLCFLVSMFFVTVIVTLNTAASAAGKKEQVSQSVSIEGTYKLISRKLPDGTIQSQPDIMGLLTYTKSSRNFNIIWKDAKGKFFSISLVSTYKLTTTKYSETSLYYIKNDQIGGKETIYDISSQTGTSPVTVKDGRIEFKLPLFNEPSLVFEGDKMTATGEGFVDYWQKVK